MKKTLKFIKQQLVEAWDVAKLQWKSFTIAICVVAFFYAMSIFFAPGWVSYAFSIPPAFVVAITSLARVNDIGPEKMGRRWEVRKISLIMAGAGSVMIMGTPFSDEPLFPTWRTVIVLYGFAGAWMTTPGMPPWDYYITGAYRFLHENPDKVPSPLSRILTCINGELTPEQVEELRRAWELTNEERRKGSSGRRMGDGVDQ